MSSTISITYKFEGDKKSLKELTSQADGLNKAFNGAAVQADQLPKKMGGLKSMAGGLAKSLGGLAAGVVSVHALVRVMGNAVGVMKDFEKANSVLASVLGKSLQEIEGLTQSAMDLGKTTSFTASEVTELQTALARLGFSEPQITAMQESVLKFAAAVGTDLGSAADFAGSALRSFGLKASDSGDLLDIMAASTSRSALSFSKLQESIAVVGPVANAFGLSARDTVSLLGVLSNAGFDASSAATALRNILLNLADSNGKLAKGLGHTAKTMPEIIDALRELRDRGVDLNETLAMTDKRSVAAFNALVAGADDVGNLYEQLGNANGELDRMYETMEDNLEGATDRLKSAWQDFALAFKNAVIPVLRTTYEWLAKLLLTASSIVKGDFFRFGARKTDKELAAYMEQYKGKPEQLEADLAKAREGYEYAKGAGPAFEKAKELAQRKVWMLEEVKMLQEQAAAAKEAEEALAALDNTETTETETTGGSASGKKTLADAVQEYVLSVERAVEANKALGEKTTDMDARLQAMKSGISSLITRYGAESEAVKKLIGDYQALLQTRRESSKSYDLGGGPISVVGSATTSGSIVGKNLRTFTKEATKGMTVSEALQTSLGALSGAFGDVARSVGDTAAAWLDWIGNLLSAVAQAIPALMGLAAAKKAEATANTAAMATGAGSSVASIPYVGPVLAISAIASVLAAVANLPKFAKGGVVSGPTFGLMGEYAGAAHNPEVIAPLNTLRQYIQPAGVGGSVDFRIRGRDLYGVLSTEDRRKSRG